MAHPHDLEEIRARRKEVEERMMAAEATEPEASNPHRVGAFLVPERRRDGEG